MKVKRNVRGFEVVDFADFYKVPCSLQQSSIALCPQPGASCIWLGTDTADPKIMAKHAAVFGVETTETTGWVPYPLPDEVLLTTRMHLSRAHVKKLIPLLQNWLATGSFKRPQKVHKK